MSRTLEGRRVLVTQADDYMGPAIAARFESEGAHVFADRSDLTSAGAAEEVIAAAGPIDVLVANLAYGPCWSSVAEIIDEDWVALFDRLVHPLMRLTRAAIPAMIERRAGKIVAVTSATPLRAVPRLSAYAAARGAQNAFIRTVGIEVAPDNVQVNAIAQNFVESREYFSPDYLSDPERLASFRQRCPAQRLARSSEAAELAVFLASDKSDFFVGQVIPFAGGWA